MLEDYPDMAQTDEEAQKRFEKARQVDPFPEIPPALLNSADVYDYVRLASILHPFDLSKLKSASYEAGIKGRCIWWDDKGRRLSINVGVDAQEFILTANSIAFVQVEPIFRLPDYIALRFNLKITHVHRGILLGTGPLVDPGFVGRLLIPLHNLTTNHYRFKAGDGLIWIEFTKTSRPPNQEAGMGQAKQALSRRGKYVRFPENKKNLDPEQYLEKAGGNNPIRSSIPEAVRESTEASERSAQYSAESARSSDEAKSSVEGIHAFIRNVSIVGFVVFLLALAGLWWTTWGLLQGASSLVVTVQQQLREEAEKRQDQTKRL
ncbi:MAG: hypothetical protein MN733_01535, partial [Nitrososphaera sp.]|nr:hypothetical protein [Nitrososphaera sp.]